DNAHPHQAPTLAQAQENEAIPRCGNTLCLTSDGRSGANPSTAPVTELTSDGMLAESFNRKHHRLSIFLADFRIQEPPCRQSDMRQIERNIPMITRSLQS